MALAGKLRNIATLVEAGIVRPDRPDRLLRAGLALRRFGATPAAGYAAAAARRPDRVAVVDERGELTFAEVHRRTNALAHALGDHGVNEGDGVAIMCRNHRGFVEATVACSKLGAHALYLNTSFAAPQLADVLAREAPSAVIYDEDNRRGFFEPVCTHPGHLRRRLAQALMFAGLGLLQAAGAREVTVETGDMIPANALYDSIGFSEVYKTFCWKKIFN